MSSFLLRALLFSVACALFSLSTLAEQPPVVILVIDQHNLLNSDPVVPPGEVVVDASEAAPSLVFTTTGGTPEHWDLLASPLTFNLWLNLSAFSSSESRRFEWRSSDQFLSHWAITNRSVIQWRLSEDSSFGASSRLILDTFSHDALSRPVPDLFGPSFDVRLIPPWAYFLLRRADILSSEQAYSRLRSLIQTKDETPSISAVVDSLWDAHGVWIGYSPDASSHDPYPLQPHLASLESSDVAHLSHPEIAQILFSLRFKDNTMASPRSIPPAFLDPFHAQFPQLRDVNLWRALDSAQKFNLIIDLAEGIASHPPSRFRQFAPHCWLNPDMDGSLASISSYFHGSPLSSRVFCWILSSRATGLPQFVQDWLLSQDIEQFRKVDL